MRKVDELLKELEIATQKYQRVTQKRLSEADSLLTKIEKIVEEKGLDVEEIWLETDSGNVRFKWICSNVGCIFVLQDEEYRVLPWKISQIGGHLYLHGDFNCYIKFMDREQTLSVLRSLPAIIGQLLRKIEELTDEVEKIAIPEEL